MTTLILKEEVYSIVGSCMEVWKILGYGFSEIVYKDAMEIEFVEKKLNYVREEELMVSYKGENLRHRFRSDFTFEGQIILEVKSGDDGIIEKTISQLLNYMKASGCRVGVIVNFGKTKLEYKRLIL